MNYKKVEYLILVIIMIIVAGMYLYTVAPTLSFWDCGEFIASAYTLAVPHPPGTPFYVLLGRIWLIIFGIISAVIPISREIAWHMNLLGIVFSVLTIYTVYKILMKLFRVIKNTGHELRHIIVAAAASLAIGFYFTVWQNAIETEVYAASTFVFVLIHYLVILWYESVRQGTSKHHYLLFTFYLIFLSSGIHLTPFLIFLPVYAFVFIVNRIYLKDALLLLLGIFQVLMFTMLFLVPASLYQTILVIIGILLGVALLIHLGQPKRFSNWRFFWAGVFLVTIGISTELYLPIRAAKLTQLYQDKTAQEQYLAGDNIAPRINECNPGNKFSFDALFDYNSAFNYVLHRGQYGPQRIIPRQTQKTAGLSGLVTGYYWQVDLFVRYLSWQPIPEDSNRLFRALVLGLFYLLGIVGGITLCRREKKFFALMMTIVFMLVFAMVGYLNLKFSPSDGNPQHQPREVRERDYFFHTGHVYFGILVGLGCLGAVEYVSRELKGKRLVEYVCLGAVVAFSCVPLVTNIRVSNRYGNFIPKDYGYNMLISCDDGAVVFTNGDNDTFPLWFVQEVLGVKRKVIVANLSLINTDWYIKQLKYWGTPISFSEYQIERLYAQGYFVTKDRQVFLLKDIMVRDIIATNAGIKLKDADYFISQEEFAARYLKGYRGALPIYFATTVSFENYKGFIPYLRLEGLVYRVVGDSCPSQHNVNIEKTENMFFTTYRYTGVFPPHKYGVLAQILTDFDKRKSEGEFYDFTIQTDENTMRLFTNYATSMASLGLALQERGEYGRALKAWQFGLAFELDRISDFLTYNIGALYIQSNDSDSAELYFEQIDTDDPNLLVRIATAYQTAGIYDKAIEYFLKARTIRPRSPGVFSGLYNVFLDKGDTASAIQILQDWLRINPQDTMVVKILQQLKKK